MYEKPPYDSPIYLFRRFIGDSTQIRVTRH